MAELSNHYQGLGPPTLDREVAFDIILDGNANLSGASRRVGGREDIPPASQPSPPATEVATIPSGSVAAAVVAGCTVGAVPGSQPATGKRWTPPCTQKKTVPPSSNDRNDVTFRKVRGILNKLTPDKFDKLSLELLNVGIDSQTVLKGIILLIFDKALDEPKYSSLYAQLCHRLCQDAPNFEPQQSSISTFRRLLLTKCQDEFENRSRATEVFEKAVSLTAEEAEACTIAKAKMLGNIKFIGELGKLDMLHETIMHRCIQQLLEKKKSGVKDMSEDLECLCQILRTVGKTLDQDKAKAWMDQYFERIKSYQSNEELPSRIRFMLQDVVELRGCNWQPRKLQGREGAPRTIQQVREEVAKESGILILKPGMLSPTYTMTVDPFFGPSPVHPMNNGGPGGRPGGASGLSDIFATMQPPSYGGGGWTGGGGGGSGGVLHIDNFAKGYNSKQHERQQQQYNLGGNSGFDQLTGGGRQQLDDDLIGGGGGGSRGGYRGRGGRGGYGGSMDRGGGGGGYRDDGSDGDTHGEGVSGMWRRGVKDRGGFHDDSGALSGGGGSSDGGGRGGYQGGGGFDEKHHKTSGGQQQSGGRELPPRFQRKQQQQMKDSSPPTHDMFDMGGPSAPYVPSQRSGGPSHMVPYPNQPPGVYQPSMPMMPSMMGPPPQRPPFAGSTASRVQQPGSVGPAVGGEDVNLRPMRNFSPSLRPNTPGMLPKSAQPPQSFASRNNSAMFGGAPLTSGMTVLGGGPGGPTGAAGPLTQQQITVKQVPTLDKHKDKGNKSTAASNTVAVVSNAEQVKQTTEETLKLYLEGTIDTAEAVRKVKELKLNKSLIAELTMQIMLYGLQKTDTERETICGLLLALKEKNIISAENFLEGFNSLLEQLSAIEADNPLAKSHAARFSAYAVANGIITLVDLSPSLNGGAYYPLFLLCLQQIVKLKDTDWLSTVFNESKINLINMLPEANKSKMMDILEDRGLSFLFPLLRIQSDLVKQLRADLNPAAYYKWIRENVDSRLHSDPGFITLLVTTIIRYVTTDTTMKEGFDANTTPDKVSIEAEKQLLSKFKGVLQKFLQDKLNLHVTAVYAVQIYAYDSGSPKGLLLRLFETLYDMGVVYDEAFLKWKEDVNDLNPGKQKALFQVNQWLTWLEEAESESEDEG